MNTPRLTVSHLQHSFGRTQVLADISFSLEAGEVCALVGPSGCGKSTLLHLCNGLLDLQDGDIASDFTNPATLFQQPRLLPWKTALDNIALSLKARGVPHAQRHAQAVELALRLGLTREDLDKFPRQLSGGMQSRVALARALLPQPDLLLLDEPFSALDIGLKTELYALLQALQAERGIAVLMITHDLMEAVRLSDRILLMAAEPGRIVGRFALHQARAHRDDAWVYQTTAQLLQQPVVRESFGLPTPRAHAETRPGTRLSALTEDNTNAPKRSPSRC
jgi:NitT/TauT family transport system ATP-binding protein